MAYRIALKNVQLLQARCRPRGRSFGGGALMLRINHFDRESLWTAIGAGMLLLWLALSLRKT